MVIITLFETMSRYLQSIKANQHLQLNLTLVMLILLNRYFGIEIFTNEISCTIGVVHKSKSG